MAERFVPFDSYEIYEINEDGLNERSITPTVTYG